MNTASITRALRWLQALVIAMRSHAVSYPVWDRPICVHRTLVLVVPSMRGPQACRWGTMPQGGLALTLFVAVLALVAGCGKKEVVQAPPAPEVTVMTVTPRDTPVDFEFTAQTESSREVEIRARVDGFLDKRTILEGQLVQDGADALSDGPQAIRGRAADGERSAGAAAGATHGSEGQSRPGAYRLSRRTH